MPGAYFWLENQLVPQLSSGYCVHEAGVLALRQSYPAQAACFNFVPTWVDAEVFFPDSDTERGKHDRATFRSRSGIDTTTKLIVTVGRLDTSKNPGLLLDAFARLAKMRDDVALGFVGDGVLRKTLEARVGELGLERKVHFFGLRPPSEIAGILRAADIFALSSAYEGMPMALLEGLGSGLPVVTTDVGEVRRVVSDKTGVVVREHAPEPFCAALDLVLRRLNEVSGKPCVDSIQNFQPARVLEPIYENYRRLGCRQVA